jgi:hypothetical protein
MGLALAAIAVPVAACTATEPVKTVPSSLPPRAATFIGDEITTAHGNRVTVERYLARVNGTPATPGHVVAAIKVRTCASSAASAPVSVRRGVFYLLLHSGLVRPVARETIKSPLIDQSLNPGDCTEGWISYQRPTASAPIGVVLSGSTVALWKIRAPGVTSGTSSTSAGSTTSTTSSAS